jgi:hypothetical protein
MCNAWDATKMGILVICFAELEGCVEWEGYDAKQWKSVTLKYCPGPWTEVGSSDEMTGGMGRTDLGLSLSLPVSRTDQTVTSGGNIYKRRLSRTDGVSRCRPHDWRLRGGRYDGTRWKARRVAEPKHCWTGGSLLDCFPFFCASPACLCVSQLTGVMLTSNHR